MGRIRRFGALAVLAVAFAGCASDPGVVQSPSYYRGGDLTRLYADPWYGWSYRPGHYPRGFYVYDYPYYYYPYDRGPSTYYGPGALGEWRARRWRNTPPLPAVRPRPVPSSPPSGGEERTYGKPAGSAGRYGPPPRPGARTYGRR